MKAVRFHQKGLPEVLQVDTLPTPNAGEGEVLIKVEAAGINYGDILRRSGRHYPFPTCLPFAPGTEVVGVIEKTGQGVESDLMGRRVFASPDGGGYAEYATARVATLFPAPAELDAAKAIALMDAGVTALLLLRKAGRLQPGESVLVPAAAGGVGSLAIQLGRLYGAEKIIGMASTPDKRAKILEMGVDAAIDYTQDNWALRVLDATDGLGVDLALEMTGGAVFHETLAAVRAQHGRVVVYGNASDQAVTLDPRILLRRNMSLTGFLVFQHGESRGPALAELCQFAIDGRLQPQVGGVYSLAAASDAHALMESRRSSGKLVLMPWLEPPKSPS